MNIENHLLENVKFLNSENFDNRPDNINISLIVIHSISLPPTIFGNNFVEDFFQNKLKKTDDEYLNKIRKMKVSSHLYIKRTGEIIQFVPFNKRAWHAGKSSYENIDNCNDYSIGIELEGCEDISYEELQYKNLSIIIKSLMKKYKHINEDRIVSHSDIAPGRKLDPGPLFDWKRLKTMIKYN
jgi:AmpD protein